MVNSQIQIFTHYRPAELKEGKVWYISYYVLNPASNKLDRKRIKINRINSITERRKTAKTIIAEINLKLSKGWNPFLEQDAPKSFIIVTDALNVFLRVKQKELRADSIRSYASGVKIFTEWCVLNGYNKTLLPNFNRTNAREFLSFIENKGVTNLTYNNYLRVFRLIWNWLKENLYTNNNPFDNITPKKRQQKSRVIIPTETRNLIKEHLIENNPEFLAICLLVFGSLIRPKEISYLKKEDFDFNNQTIRVPAEISKNNKLRISTIPNYNLEILKNCVNKSSPGQFVFGIGLKPSYKRQCSRLYAKKWNTIVRKPLKLSMDMKLYSLRDSGIVQLLSNGVSPHDVMRLADHKDLTITTAYLPYANPKGNQSIKDKSSGF